MTYLWDINSGYSTKSGRYKTEIELSFICKYLPDKKIDILDIGGGSGRFAIPLAEKGNFVTLLETNEEALILLKQRNDSVKCVNKPFENFKLKKKYDLILAIEVVGNFNSLNYFFHRIHKMMNNDSFFIFSATNTNSYKYILSSYFKKKYHYPGFSNFKKYKSLLENNSLDLVDIKGFNWLPLKVNSNSLMVPVFTYFERILCLNKWLNQSPELLFCSKKN